MTYVAIMDWEVGGKIGKYMDFTAQNDADAHVATHLDAYPNAFVAVHPGGTIRDWRVNTPGTISFDYTDAIAESKVSKCAAVDALKIIKMASFTFGGKTYQSEHDSRDNIMGSATWASVAIIGGAQVGDYRWHGGASDFQFIAADNSKVTMDAQTVKALGETMGLHLYLCIQNARIHKDNIESLATSSPPATVADIEIYDITTGWPV